MQNSEHQNGKSPVLLSRIFNLLLYAVHADDESLDSLRVIRLRDIVSVIQGGQGIEFLRSKFEERLRNGSVTLQNTQVGILFCLLKNFFPTKHASL